MIWQRIFYRVRSVRCFAIDEFEGEVGIGCDALAKSRERGVGRLVIRNDFEQGISQQSKIGNDPRIHGSFGLG